MDGKMKSRIIDLEIINELLPVARIAGRLRACGIRIAGEPEALAALRELYNEGDQAAGVIIANMFPNGHPEVSRAGR